MEIEIEKKPGFEDESVELRTGGEGGCAGGGGEGKGEGEGIRGDAGGEQEGEGEEGVERVGAIRGGLD